jgi:hypothetical protein
MPDLSFFVTNASVYDDSRVAFQLRIVNSTADEAIQMILLRCQMQIDALRRRYTPREQAELFDLFGPPEDWGRTLRSVPWTQTALAVREFIGSEVLDFDVPWHDDLGGAADKYFHGLEEGDVPAPGHRVSCGHFGRQVSHESPEGGRSVGSIPARTARSTAGATAGACKPSASSKVAPMRRLKRGSASCIWSRGRSGVSRRR